MNIDEQVNYQCGQTEALIDELDELAIEKNMSLEEEIEQYNKEERQEILEKFNIEGCMNYELHIIKYDESHRNIDKLTFVCCGEDLTCILEYALKYGCEVISISLFEESHKVLFGSFNHEAKFKVTLQYKYRGI